MLRIFLFSRMYTNLFYEEQFWRTFDLMDTLMVDNKFGYLVGQVEKPILVIKNLRGSIYTLKLPYKQFEVCTTKPAFIMGSMEHLKIGKPRFVTLDQLVTVSDLQAFKTELLLSIKNILSDANKQLVKKWLKSYEVKKMMDISSGTLQNLRANGTLPFTKIGGIIYYNLEDIEKVLESKKKTGRLKFNQ